VTHWGEKRK